MDRLILPIMLPLGAMLVTFIVVLLISQVLLATGATTVLGMPGKQVAPLVALAIALGVLGGCAYAASRRGGRAT
ncbi:MAG: hypothetical protein HYY05_08275 [Chloroflexi bacterium]|nr:hypothetical protein [Chloroflexota bacterium]